MKEIIVKKGAVLKNSNKFFVKQGDSLKRVRKILRKDNNALKVLWERKIRDSALLQFNDFTDYTGAIWTPINDPEIIQDSRAIGNNWLYLDGTSYLQTDSTTISNFGTGDFTIECWIMLDTSESGKILTIYSSGLDTQNRTFLAFGINNFNQPFMQIYNINTGLNVSTGMGSTGGGFNIYSGKEYHVAIVRSNGQILWFLDGVSKGWTTSGNWTSYNIASALGSFIGRRVDIEGNQYKGFLDQFRVTKRAVYTKNFTPLRIPYAFND